MYCILPIIFILLIKIKKFIDQIIHYITTYLEVMKILKEIFKIFFKHLYHFEKLLKIDYLSFILYQIC